MLVSSRRLFEKFMNDRALTLASLLAWGMLNTFLPLLLGILSLVGLVLGDSPIAVVVQERILAALPAPASGMLSDTLAAFEKGAGVAGLVSLGFLLFNGSNFFVTLESVFDLAYHVPERNILWQRVVSFAALFTVTALFLVAASAAVLGTTLGEMLAGIVPELAPLIEAGIGPAVSMIGLASMLILLYWLIPNRRHSFRHALPGAALAFVLLLLVRLFPVYVQFFGGGFNVYAAFGTVLLFMFWLYIVGVMLIGGAVLNAFLEDPQGSTATSAFAAGALSGAVEVPPAFADR